MQIVIFNWRTVPLVVGALAAGVGSALLVFLLGADETAVFVGIAAAGLTLLFVDYFRWRRIVYGGTPMWRLIDPGAGGHVYFVPCWIWGGLAVFLAAIGLVENSDRVAQASKMIVGTAIGSAALLLPPVFEFIRPFDKFRWAAREPKANEPLTPK